MRGEPLKTRWLVVSHNESVHGEMQVITQIGKGPVILERMDVINLVKTLSSTELDNSDVRTIINDIKLLLICNFLELNYHRV